jgi:hypothetical protein
MGRKVVFYSFKLFLPAFAALIGRGEGQHPVGAMDNAYNYDSILFWIFDRTLKVIRKNTEDSGQSIFRWPDPHYQSSCGAMDNASDYESEDCRFESCQDRFPFIVIQKDVEDMRYLAYQWNDRGPVAHWTTRLTTNQKIAGSSPARIGYLIFSWPNSLWEVLWRNGHRVWLRINTCWNLSATSCRLNTML